jgi:hypothetical protein
MKQFKRNMQLALATLFAVSGLAVVPVIAAPGGAKVSAQETTTSTDDSTDDSDVKPTGRIQELRERAKTKLTEDRKEKKTAVKAEGKQKACEARVKNLNKKVKNFGAAAQRHLDRLDKTYDKLQAFQEEKKLNADQYDALVKIADEKKTAATEAVAALKEVAVDIDCTSTDPAESVATVKEAVKNARVSLQQYHTSVKNVLVELMTSKSDSKKDGDSGDKADDSSETDSGTGGTN